MTATTPSLASSQGRYLAAQVRTVVRDAARLARLQPALDRDVQLASQALRELLGSSYTTAFFEPGLIDRLAAARGERAVQVDAIVNMLDAVSRAKEDADLRALAVALHATSDAFCYPTPTDLMAYAQQLRDDDTYTDGQLNTRRLALKLLYGNVRVQTASGAQRLSPRTVELAAVRLDENRLEADISAFDATDPDVKHMHRVHVGARDVFHRYMRDCELRTGDGRYRTTRPPAVAGDLAWRSGPRPVGDVIRCARTLEDLSARERTHMASSAADIFWLAIPVGRDFDDVTVDSIDIPELYGRYVARRCDHMSRRHIADCLRSSQRLLRRCHERFAGGIAPIEPVAVSQLVNTHSPGGRSIEPRPMLPELVRVIR